jgi:hypothetical protein
MYTEPLVPTRRDNFLNLTVHAFFCSIEEVSAAIREDTMDNDTYWCT